MKNYLRMLINSDWFHRMDKDHKGGEVFPTMKNYMDRKVRKLNYMIHNPNTVEVTAKVLSEIFSIDYVYIENLLV